MPIDLNAEVIQRLTDDTDGWLTTVAKSGQPVPRLVWFLLDGTDVVVYSHPTGAKVRHIGNHPRVSLNLDSDGDGGGVIVVGGVATVEPEPVDPRTDERYWAKYDELAERLGYVEMMGDFNTRIRIAVDKVWTTPVA
ncbi:PPOX class F420-dependent oxidoreductase [Mycolicibacterium insubricum]|uniref:PPOX class F420-dependent oxidoreductase n=1 Tax=Mycolicibacterium insubricum TaxID=444597 RepID=A0A1X0DCZ1_9MYCO|nr:TIGR03667 family PPOX class F420-dependent oxidoreductase [Mycolicibacterium insubricum]MCB9441077.1 TIGR03667 family PPOX class F420-dependent oxidoreductase [Mycolicibacterium sp.]MCV7082455.1 TIGR03667 family PPOX class F420-dependent oxidoreductase [Mycolicibacterium insubricum]ORA70208.1 PPOX class F420-dependent oxidoreductase [Mycolicibacterium insubricum]BBZ66090.1 PPOX class F420-dependent oxidoreductase [Mycolicibacterium insubricum]